MIPSKEPPEARAFLYLLSQSQGGIAAWLRGIGMLGKVAMPQDYQGGEIGVEYGGEKYLTIKDACERLGVSPNTLRSWGGNGKVQEYRHPINNYRLYRREDIEELRARILHPKQSAGRSHE